jgi:predicted Zn-dependent protease
MRIFLYLILLFCGFWSSSQTVDERLAIQFYESNEFEKAENIFKKLYKKRSHSALVYEYYLNTLIALENGKDAERLVETHLKKNPENIGLRVDLGMVYDSLIILTKRSNQLRQVFMKSSLWQMGLGEGAT